MNDVRIASLLSLIAAVTALVLSVLPQWYESPSGVRVGCGITLAPRNPTPPPGTDDECDAVHVRRGAVVVTILGAGAVTGALPLVAAIRRRAHARGPA